MPGRGHSCVRSRRSSGSRCQTITCGFGNPSRSSGVTRYQPCAASVLSAWRAMVIKLVTWESANTRWTRAELRSSHDNRCGKYRVRPPCSRAPGYKGDCRRGPGDAGDAGPGRQREHDNADDHYREYAAQNSPHRVPKRRSVPYWKDDHPHQPKWCGGLTRIRSATAGEWSPAGSGAT